MLFPRSLVSITDLTKKQILEILSIAQELKKQNHQEILKNIIMGSFFFEPSTRTRLSFEASIKKLGGEVIGFSNPDISSKAKGESLADFIRTISEYVDLIILRHPLEGAARLATKYTTTPIINAGDGSNQHPSQTLLDLFTIRECLGKLSNFSLGLVGDLYHGRTVHSLAQALSLFNVRFFFVSPKGLELPDTICNDLRRRKIKFSFHSHVEEIVDKVDILYLTRYQQERDLIKKPEHFYDTCSLPKPSSIILPSHIKILHPLPRGEEIPYEWDKTPNAYYFQQVANGLWIRQALITILTGRLSSLHSKSKVLV